MKAKLKINEFQRALKLCYNAIDPKDTIRSNILFSAEENLIRMKATNGLYSIDVVCNSDVSEEGKAFVDGKMAYNVVSKATGDCKLSADENSMVINASGRTKLPNINKELPWIDEVTGSEVSFDGVAFRNAIEKTKYAIGEDQSRMILTGAHITSDGFVATVTALDGFRLAQTTFDCVGSNIDIIVPTPILDAICSAITDGNIVLRTNKSRITVVGDNFLINASLLDGQYVDTARIIPTDFNINVLVNTAIFKNCVDTATISCGNTNMVKLIVEKDKLKVASNSEMADYSGEVDAAVNGEELTIAFNIRYLVQTLSKIGTEQCEVRLNSNTSPAIFAPHEEGNKDINLILPVRTF